MSTFRKAPGKMICWLCNDCRGPMYVGKHHSCAVRRMTLWFELFRCWLAALALPSRFRAIDAGTYL